LGVLGIIWGLPCAQMAHMLFHEAGLMETFQIPQREFVNYFRALEANYGNNVCELFIVQWFFVPMNNLDAFEKPHDFCLGTDSKCQEC
jgi:hypothetical protein